MLAPHETLRTQAGATDRYSAASDGLLNHGQGHPRAAGTFPRMLGRFVRERRLLSLNQAIAKMTVQPARMAGIPKGTLEPGADADITIFDPQTIIDRATFRDPLVAPLGIEQVLINGEPVLVREKLLYSNRGKALRPER
ncbi:amidohydrolase family protein [Anoxynatronum sibiricum]|uniref:Amidohydrolase family protein n=1 Tax=Anoxynatronum sibiricum TaxID=210623 RepID=A0ABU9VT79_9CLOT